MYNLFVRYFAKTEEGKLAAKNGGLLRAASDAWRKERERNIY